MPVISGTCAPLPDGGYLVRINRAFEPSAFATPAAMAQAVWDVFEERIRETPEAWLWMYKHWRYLPDTASATQRIPTTRNTGRSSRKLRAP